jgi:Leucine-rich repeat (LRR) protein
LNVFISFVDAHLNQNIDSADNDVNFQRELEAWVLDSSLGNKTEAAKRIARAHSKKKDDLDLSGLNLSTLPDIIRTLRLKTLYLMMNQFETFPEIITAFPDLEHLFLNRNQLLALSENIGKLSKLQTLNLSENQLTVLPESVGNLKELISLHLEKNAIRQLPFDLENFPNLLELQIAQNQIRALPKGFKNKLAEREGNLYGIDLTFNPLELHPSDFESINGEKLIVLSSDQMQSLLNEIEERSPGFARQVIQKEPHLQQMLGKIPVAEREKSDVEKLASLTDRSSGEIITKNILEKCALLKSRNS